ncbi:MAG: BON domain-containing protein [Candidatus Korobacteraceae bacterium]
MRTRYESVAVLFAALLMLVMVGAAQQAPPPASNQSVQTPPAGGQQPQEANEALSAESQDKLVREIRHELLMIPYYGVFDNLAFQLQGRTVILEGQVANSIVKPDAENAVKKIEGVEKVVNNIEVLPPSPLDDQIRRAVYRAIYGYGPLFKYANLSIPPIHIIVKGGHVTLDGVVDNETDKGLCTMRANQVPDVFSVTNNLRVVPSGNNKNKKK